jgi:hypothetical protein
MRSLLFWDVTQHRLVDTDFSGQPIKPIFRVQASLLEDGTDRFPQNICNYQSTLRNIPEEQRCLYALVLLMFDSVECYIHENNIILIYCSLSLYQKWKFL